ncbi:unnamed protein product [Clavelina lepadiformis]|uniref:PPIase cyclophilin-type domain-containing protein n=1 Tax=Clavelina lepadiformis TaxID=159417 RepID=A0ABP0FLS6_CLALP
MKEKHRPRVFFDVEIDGDQAGRIIFELFADVCPKTCENFRCLCTGERGLGATTKKPLHYKGVLFHRVIHDFMLQSGDFSEGNGRGGESIFGGYFADESFQMRHDKPFLLSMANRGKNTNGSQFFITTQPAPHLDGIHVVFGRVVNGEAVVKRIESQKTDANNRPLTECKVVHCGELVLATKSKKKQKKRKESVRSEEESVDASDSDDGKNKKKKKKKHKKEKKQKHTEVKEELEPEVEEKPVATTWSSISAEEIPDVPPSRFLDRIGSKDGNRSTGTDSQTPASERSQGRSWTSRSGRKIKGRGSLRYRTPSRSRSRSPRRHSRHGSWRERRGSETPPHWRAAQRAERALEKKSSADRWRRGSTSPVDEKRISPNLWESDGDVKSYHGKWSDGEDDMKSPISQDNDEVFGPKEKSTNDRGKQAKKKKKKFRQKKKQKKRKKSSRDRTKLPVPADDLDVEEEVGGRSKWDSPESHSEEESRNCELNSLHGNESNAASLLKHKKPRSQPESSKNAENYNSKNEFDKTTKNDAEAHLDNIVCVKPCPNAISSGKVERRKKKKKVTKIWSSSESSFDSSGLSAEENSKCERGKIEKLDLLPKSLSKSSKHTAGNEDKKVLEDFKKSLMKKTNKKKKPTLLPWQPPLEFGEELEDASAKEADSLMMKHNKIGSNPDLFAGSKKSLHDKEKKKSSKSSPSEDLEDALMLCAGDQLPEQNERSKKNDQAPDDPEALTEKICEEEIGSNAGIKSPTSNSSSGFGILPSHETNKMKQRQDEKKESSLIPQVRDVGIWSDEESVETKSRRRSKQDGDQGKENTSMSKISNHEKTGQNEVIEANLSGSEDNELTLHEPLPTNKKTFVFKINLPKQEAVSKEKSSKKKIKKSKKRKKDKNKTANDKTKQTKLTAAPVAPSAATLAVTTTNANVSSSNMARMTSTSHMTSVTTSTYNGNIQMNPVPHMMNPYHAYYAMNPYMVHRGIPAPIYPHPHFMGYPPRLPMAMNFMGNPLPPKNDEPPPLPDESEPERPPEPVYDSTRLSDDKMAAMFASHDVTEEAMQKFFEEGSDDKVLPSPASSRSSRGQRSSRRRKRHRSSSYSSRSSSSWSARSRSRSIFSRCDRSKHSKRHHSRSGSSRFSSRSSSYASYKRARSRRRRSSSDSYFSSSSSRDRSSFYTSSSGSDIDRPCRHYRPGRSRRRSRYRSYDRYSSEHSRSRRRRRHRSRGRSRSVTSYTSSSVFSD